MKPPQIFIPNRKRTEEKVKEIIEEYVEEESCFQELERLKTGRSREKQKEFLETFVKNISYLIDKVREKMEQTGIEEVYLDNPKDYKTRDYGYRTRLEIGYDKNLYFLHSLSGNTYQANLDDKELYSYNGYATICDYLNTYPDRENLYLFYNDDTIERHFKLGKEMYEGIKLFLKENKTL